MSANSFAVALLGIPSLAEIISLYGSKTEPNSESGIELKLDQCIIRVVELRHQAQELLHKAKARPSREWHTLWEERNDLLSNAQDIESEFITWAAALTPEWMFEKTPYTASTSDIDDFSQGLSYGSNQHYYTSMIHAALWNRYRAARLLAVGIIARTIDQYRDPGCPLTHEAAKLRDNARAKVRALCDEICTSVSFHFRPTSFEERGVKFAKTNRCRVTLLNWPLLIAASNVDIPEQQRRWIKSILGLIGRMTGNGTLKSVAEMDLHSHRQLPSSPVTKEKGAGYEQER